MEFLDEFIDLLIDRYAGMVDQHRPLGILTAGTMPSIRKPSQNPGIRSSGGRAHRRWRKRRAAGRSQI